MFDSRTLRLKEFWDLFKIDLPSFFPPKISFRDPICLTAVQKKYFSRSQTASSAETKPR